MLRIGALCAGYGGIELGAARWTDVPFQHRWVSETDTAAAEVLDARWGVPNLGDLQEISNPEPVDIVTAGFPCQPISSAGLQKGINDERWLIDDVCRVAREAQASIIILENVRRILTASRGCAMQHVVDALADNGFSRWEWTTLRASDVGAPHRRDRWFCVAYADDLGRQRARKAWGRWPRPADSGVAPADPNPQRLQERRVPEGQGYDHVPHPSRSNRFGPYEAAVERWVRLTGRAAPDPLVEGKLSPLFVEWMMGLPHGWVTDIITNRRSALKILGNGVVPQQARAALEQLTV